MPDTAIIVAGLFISMSLCVVAGSLRTIADTIRCQQDKTPKMTTEEYLELRKEDRTKLGLRSKP